MRNFTLLHAGLDIVPAALELFSNEALWNQNTLRTVTPGSPHRDVDDIWLRMTDLTKCQQSDQFDGAVADHRECRAYPAWYELPACASLVTWAAARVRAVRHGRAMISRLPPGKTITPHCDIGPDPTKHYDFEPYWSRFHVVLRGLPGSVFSCGDEQVQMRTGELWCFRGELEHSVVNESAADRVHLVMDFRLDRQLELAA